MPIGTTSAGSHPRPSVATLTRSRDAMCPSRSPTTSDRKDDTMVPNFRATLRTALVPFAMALALLGQPAQAQDDFGVLVMAHGGGPKWNGEVEASLAPLR